MVDKNVEYVEIIATFYDNTGEIIGSKSTYTQPSDLKSTMKAPLAISLSKDIANYIGSYDVTITWRYPDETTEYSNVYELSQQIQQQSNESRKKRNKNNNM